MGGATSEVGGQAQKTAHLEQFRIAQSVGVTDVRLVLLGSGLGPPSPIGQMHETTHWNLLVEVRGVVCGSKGRQVKGHSTHSMGAIH